MDGFCVLIVDDEPDIVESVAQMLEATVPGARALRAAHGVEALELLEAEEVHLILSDYRMPHMDGVEFLTQARKRWPEIPRFLITAFPDPQLAARAVKEAGVGLFVAKPFDVSYIAELLKAFAPNKE